MKKVVKCFCCGRVVEKDAVSLYRKIIDIDADKFLCMECLANHLDCTIRDLLDKIEEFKDEGCTLFK